jgi:hypothetical protein
MLSEHAQRVGSLRAVVAERWAKGEVLCPGDEFSEYLHDLRNQEPKEVKRGFDTPTETGNFWVRGPGERAVERVSNMDSSWIREYESANFREPSDLGWKRPAHVAEEQATRVAMRFRSRRAARA